MVAMARYQPQGGRGPQPSGMLPARRQLPPPEPPVRQRAQTAMLLGSLGVAVSALWLLVLAVFWPQLNAYYNCMSGANTVTAQQVCHKQFTDSVGSEISLLQTGRLRTRVRTS